MTRKPLYINGAATISHQPTFGQSGFSGGLEALADAGSLVSPDYKAYIDPGLLRRMSKILRMSVACSKESLQHAGVAQPDAIVVGTGLGCLQDTEKFLNTSLTVEGLLPPTSFIQSTHNTMAGQVSLSLGNHGYNMTHTQNTLSFEHALIDAGMLLREGDHHVLVGAADEYIEILDDIATRLELRYTYPLTSGASFFVVSNEMGSNVLAALTDVYTVGGSGDVRKETEAFLRRNGVELKDIDLMLHTGVQEPLVPRHVNYLALSGVYATASAFALHYALDVLRYESGVRNVLICNSLRESNLGLILLKNIEA